MNIQRQRARDAAAAAAPKPLPRPGEKKAKENMADEGSHGDVQKVETIVHHSDGTKDHQEHASTKEAADHLAAVGGDGGPEDGGGHDAEIPCPECQGNDPKCPLCNGTGMVPADEAEQAEESGGGGDGY